MQHKVQLNVFFKNLVKANVFRNDKLINSRRRHDSKLFSFRVLFGWIVLVTRKVGYTVLGGQQWSLYYLRMMVHGLVVLQ